MCYMLRVRASSTQNIFKWELDPKAVSNSSGLQDGTVEYFLLFRVNFELWCVDIKTILSDCSPDGH